MADPSNKTAAARNNRQGYSRANWFAARGKRVGLAIFDSGRWKLGLLGGPDAEGFLAWRASMTDEQWIDWGAQSDEDWAKSARETFGLNVKI